MAADPVVVLAGTLDTKGHELEYTRDRVREAGAEVLLADVGVLGDPQVTADVSREGVATALAERQLVMVGGQIAAETTAQELQNDPDAQRRYLGVEPIATEE